jgi:DNA-binding MarR family transcriptional regulator
MLRSRCWDAARPDVIAPVMAHTGGELLTPIARWRDGIRNKERRDRDVQMSSRARPVDAPAATKGSSIELGALQESLGFFILRASRKLSHEWINRWHGREHRPIFYCAFALIGANPGISPAELARFLVLDKSRASDLIGTLEAEHSITRRRHADDHRRQGLYLTADGTAKLAAVLVEMRMEDERLHQLFSAEERQQLITALGRVADFE